MFQAAFDCRPGVCRWRRFGQFRGWPRCIARAIANTISESELGGVGPNSDFRTIFLDRQRRAGHWMTGSIGLEFAVNAVIDPQLFSSDGVGTLGGGDITVTAGRDISDLSVVATSALTTGATPRRTAAA